MSEKAMVAAVQAALDHHGIEDRVEVVGQFEPRGRSGGQALGGIAASDLGGALGGDLGRAIGLGAGFAVGGRAADSASDLPRSMLVGASPTMVYGFRDQHGRTEEPTELVFQVPRADLDVVVHARVNVRVLELIETATGVRVELEGVRIPVSHSHDLIKYLAGHAATTTADAEAAAAGETLDPR